MPYAWARAQRVLSLRGGRAQLTVSPRTPEWALREIRCHGDVEVAQVEDEALETLLTAAYSHAEDAASVMGVAENEIDLDRLLQDMPEVADLLEAQDDAPVIRMINALFAQAARDGASDIHIEPFETHSVVRYRVDGTLRDVVSPRRATCRADLAHQDHGPPGHRREAPAAGRPHRAARGRTADRRARVHLADRPRRARRAAPLDKEAGRLKLERLGMSAGVLERLDRLIRQPHGIVLVTGPTGSGKTTTLYAALSRLDASTSNILTVEDPIEYDLPGISQTQVNAKIDMSFALALRAILRQDPDVIMIGEIRDLETAQIAVQASLTGHLVLATLHTNDAVSAVTRLTDMGVEPFLLASSLLGVLAQRLVPAARPASSRPSTKAAASTIRSAAPPATTPAAAAARASTSCSAWTTRPAA